MKKIFIIGMIMICSTCMVFAGPRGGRGGRGGSHGHGPSYHHSGGGHHHHHHHHGGGSDGVRLAADIVGLVGASLDILSPRTVVVNSPAPAYTVPTPVYVEPQPVYSSPVPAYAAPTPIYQPIPPPTIVYQPGYRRW